jgi:hypothetical protein
MRKKEERNAKFQDSPLRPISEKTEKLPSFSDNTRKDYFDGPQRTRTGTQQQKYGTLDPKLDLDLADETKSIRRIYVKSYVGSPFSMVVSVMKNGRDLGKLNKTINDDKKSLQSNLYSLLSSIGLTITSFEAAPIKLNAIEAEHIWGDRDEVLDTAKSLYM